MIFGVWAVSFTILGLADPIFSAFQYFISEISQILRVVRGSVLLVIVFCFYVTILIVLSKSKMMRDLSEDLAKIIGNLLRSTTERILKSEKSFYSVSNGSDPSNETYLPARLKLLEDKISKFLSGDLGVNRQPSKEEWGGIKKAQLIQ